MQVRMRLFFTDAAPAEIYTLSLHDALPISFAQRRSELDDRGMRKDSAQLLISVQSLLHLISRSEEHTSELQSQSNLVCRLLLEKKKKRPHALDLVGVREGICARVLGVGFTL